MRLLNFNDYREAQALGYMKGEVLPDENKDLTNEIISILREFDPTFTQLFTRITQSGDESDQFRTALKKLMGLLKNLRERPDERRKSVRDPLSNTVARAHDGADGPSGGDGGGG